MPKKLLRKYLPDPEKIKQHKSLQFLGHRLHETNLWHLNRRSVSLAFAVGLFFAWVPTPTQMAMAAITAFYVRANLPISVALVWITNPLTMPPLFYFSYLVGLHLLNEPQPVQEVEFSVLSSLGDALVPFLLGCFVLGVICSVFGYFGIQAFWYHHVGKQWQARKKRLQAKP